MKSPADICMFAHNGLRNDARVQKEAASLSRAGWRVIVVGIALSETELPPVEEFEGFVVQRVIPPLPAWTTRNSWGKLLRLLVAIPLIIWRIRATRARAFHAHDFPGLLLMALAGIWQRPVIYDAHELFFERWPKDSRYGLLPLIRALRPVEGWLARRAKVVIVSAEKHADFMRDTLNIACPAVILNCVDLRRLDPPTIIYPRDGYRLIVHSGNLHPFRHLPELVSAMQYAAPNIRLVLMGDGSLRDALIQQAHEQGLGNRVVMIPAVAVNKVAPTQTQADAAIVLVSSETIHYDLAMANKFFEAVAAGLPIISSPTTAAAAVMKEYDLGLLVDPTDPQAIAEAMTLILEPETHARYRANALKAREVLNWEVEERKLVALYRQVFDGLL
jgi:glycosyltransferase involved in cell wall biosynthesis